MPTPTIVVDGVTATSSVFVVSRGVGASAALSVSNQNGISSLLWSVRELPAGSAAALGATGNAPTFATTLGPFDLPGRYLVSAVANGDPLNQIAWLDYTITAYPQVYALVSVGGGQVAANGTVGGSGPSSSACAGWKKESDSTGAAYFVQIWR